MLQDYWDRHPGLYGVWHEIQEMKFISDIFDLVFKFLAKLAEPFMFASILYAITKVTLPHVVAGMDSWAGNASVAILNNAPEIILPSCFMAASKAYRESNKRVMWLYGVMGCIFLLLTLTTMGMFVGAANPGADKVILFARCAMGVLYSVLVRVFVEKKENGRVVRTVQVSAKMEEVQADLKNGVQEFKDLQIELKNALIQDFKNLQEELKVTMLLTMLQDFKKLQIELKNDLIQDFKNHQIELNNSLLVAFKNGAVEIQEDGQVEVQEVLLEMLQNQAEALALLPVVVERFAQLEALTQAQFGNAIEEFQQVKITVERSLPEWLEKFQRREIASPPMVSQKATQRAPLKFTGHTSQALAGPKFNKTAFVLECLKANPEMETEAIKERAAKLGHTISDPIISMARGSLKTIVVESDKEDVS